MVDGSINGHPVKALWDTWAQVSIISEDWLQHTFPDEKIRQIDELLEGQDLQLKAANETCIPFNGFVELDFCISISKQETGGQVQVPFLVAPSSGENIILGFNVIEEMLNLNKGKNSKIIQHVGTLAPWLQSHQVKEVVNVVTTGGHGELCRVRVDRIDIRVPKQSAIEEPCRVSVGLVTTDETVLFEPIEEGLSNSIQMPAITLTLPKTHSRGVQFMVCAVNNSNHDVVLCKKKIESDSGFRSKKNL